MDVDDLIDTQSVAQILGLAHRNTVSECQARYADMSRPVVDLAVPLRPEGVRWAAVHRERVGGRGRHRLITAPP